MASLVHYIPIIFEGFPADRHAAPHGEATSIQIRKGNLILLEIRADTLYVAETCRRGF